MHSSNTTIQWIPILGYHRVVEELPPRDYWNVCTTRQRFYEQMAWFARLGWRTLSLEEAGARLVRGERVPPQHFVITFDDGYVDTLTVALPILEQFGFTATVFMVAGLVGQQSIWDDGHSWVAPLMTWEQLGEVVRRGFSVGSHTVSHPHLSRLPGDAVRRELIDSRSMLEKQLGIPVRTFCYPYGDWSTDVCAAVAEAGYDVACNNVGRREHGRYILARTDPGYWHPALTPLVRSQPWYFEANRRGWLEMPQRSAATLRRTLTGRSQKAGFVPSHDVEGAATH